MKRIDKDLITRLMFCVALLSCSVTLAFSQSTNTDDYPKLEGFIGYSALGEINSRGIGFGGDRRVSGNYAADGFETSIIRNFGKHLGLKGDFSAHFNNKEGHGAVTLCTPVCTTATQDFQLKTRVYNFLVGPELKARNRTRFTPFAHLLGGVALTRADFTTTGPTINLFLKQRDTSFALAVGGGLDVRVTKRVSLRGLLDYNPVFVNDSTSGTRDLVRISFGVLFR